MGIVNDLTRLKTLSDGVVANKVSRFAYKERAYTQNEVDGVNSYDASQDNNIPVGTANVMKVNQTVIELGWRARASSITRMLMNHFLGRVSYNLNKVNDWFNELLSSMLANLGQPDGIALLNSNGIVPDSMLPSSLVRNVSDITPDNSGKVDLTKQTDITKILSNSLIGQIFGRLFGTHWVDSTISGISFASAIKYADGLWVACTRSGGVNLLWSEDGLVWTACTGIPNSFYSKYIDYVGGLWFTGGASSNGLYWSTDGKSWNACTGDITSSTFDVDHYVVYAEGLYVCSAQENVGYPYWSTDGKAWTRGTETGGQSFRHVVYGNNIWLASAGRDAGISKSTNGKDWSVISSSVIGGYSVEPNYANGLFVTSGDKTAWSVDGTTWTLATGSDLLNSNGSGGMTYLNGVWFCISSLHIFKSYDGKSWQDKATLSDGIYKIAYAEGLLLLGGENCTYKSTDMGESFEKGISVWAYATEINILEYGNGRWLIADSGNEENYGLKRSDYNVLLEKGMLQ